MKKYILITALIAMGTAYGQTPAPTPKKPESNPCGSLEQVCQNARYLPGKTNGRDLYQDCISLIISGFPPSDVHATMNKIPPKDISDCRDQIQQHIKKY